MPECIRVDLEPPNFFHIGYVEAETGYDLLGGLPEEGCNYRSWERGFLTAILERKQRARLEAC